MEQAVEHNFTSLEERDAVTAWLDKHVGADTEVDTDGNEGSIISYLTWGETKKFLVWLKEKKYA